MDSLFIMQRYWGSDEEDNEEKIMSCSDLSEQSYRICKKKKNDISLIEDGANYYVEEVLNDVNSSKLIDITSEKSSILEKSVHKEKKNSLIKEKRHKSKVVENTTEKLIECFHTENATEEHNNLNSICVERNSNLIDMEEKKNSSKKEKRRKSKVLENTTEKLIEAINTENATEEHDDVNSIYVETGSNLIDITDEKSSSLEKTVDEEKKNSKKEKRNKSKIKEIENTIKELNKAESLNTKNATEERQEINPMYLENTSENFCTIGQVQNEKEVKVRRALPHWLSNPTYIGVNLLEEETPISEISYLDSNTKKNLEDSGINFLFPVQLAVIPWLLQSKEKCLLIRPSDICVSAPTGSGKTLAFVIPIVQSLKDRVVHAVRALVVLPVSELAIQVFKVFETFVRGTDLKVALLTGQKSFLAEQNSLVKANGQKLQCLVDIVVTTPGRIYDHIYKTKGFCLKRLRYLVIDEADRMLEEIQQGWLKKVEDAVFNDCVFSNCVCCSLQRIPQEPSSAFNFGFISQPLQKLLYSATLTHDPEQLHNLSLYKPKLFTASSSCVDDPLETCAIPPGLSMLHIVCDVSIKPMIICHFIKVHNFKRVLCFTETVERAHRLHLVLEEMGLLEVREISSFNRVIQRKIVLEQFSSGKVDILVCSDLVARGIDIENIDCVISYDVPQSIKSYIHRIGRTARAGKTGTAVALLTNGEIPHFKKMLKSAGIEMPEKFNISTQDLSSFVNSYQTALIKADSKLKNEKKQQPGRPLKKMSRKRKQM